MRRIASTGIPDGGGLRATAWKVITPSCSFNWFEFSTLVLTLHINVIVWCLRTLTTYNIEEYNMYCMFRTSISSSELDYKSRERKECNTRIGDMLVLVGHRLKLEGKLNICCSLWLAVECVGSGVIEPLECLVFAILIYAGFYNWCKELHSVFEFAELL